MDPDNGQILSSENPHYHIQAASLTKVITLFLIFEALNQGTVKLNDEFVISKKSPSNHHIYTALFAWVAIFFFQKVTAPNELSRSKLRGSFPSSALSFDLIGRSAATSAGVFSADTV